MDSTRNEYLGIFLEESQGMLTEIGNCLLDIEKNPNNSKTIDELFRCVHTIKGTSKQLMSHFESEFPDDVTIPTLHKIGILTHTLEDFLSIVRKELANDPSFIIDSQQIDVIFVVEEVIENLVFSLKENKEDDIDITPHLSELNKLVGAENSHSTNTNENERTKLDEDDNPLLEEVIKYPSHFNELKIQLFLNLTDEMKGLAGAFATMSFKEIKEKYPYSTIKPSIKDMMKTDNYVVEDIFITIYSEEEQETIEAFVESIRNVKTIKSLSFTTEEMRLKKRLEEEEKKKQNREKEKTNTSKGNIETISVRLDRIDEMYKNTSELVIVKNAMKNLAPHLEGEIGKQLQVLIDELDTIVEDSQKVTMNIRMTPLEQLFDRFPMDVRRTAKEENKNVIFEMDHGKTEIDKTLLDQLGKPLMHIIRNSIAHGIESEEERLSKGKSPEGNVYLRARHEQSFVIIEVEDDGRGIETEKVKQKAIANGIITEDQASMMKKDEINALIFHPGLSTANEITENKGRGVGLDFVKTEIQEKMKGSIIIESIENVGTKFIIKLNLTLAIITSMIVKINGEVFAIPSSNVVQFQLAHKDEIRYVANNEVFLFFDKELPVIRLKKYFNLSNANVESEYLHLVIVNVGKHSYALAVDEFEDKMNIVVRSFGSFLGNLVGIGGSFVLPNGDIGLIIDLNSLNMKMSDKQKS